MLQSFLFILPVEKVLSEIAVKYVDILRCVRYKVRYIQEISVMKFINYYQLSEKYLWYDRKNRTL